MALHPGTRLGPYEIVRSLGAGGMGEVYLADDTRLRRRIALKVLPAGVGSNAQAAERLLREARAAARLDHPNICTVYDTGEIDGQSFIAMQFVDGEDLAGRLVRKPLDLDGALAIAGQAAHALAAAHHQGIIHRDIKPQNIMVTPSGQAKVLDFGLAQTIGSLGNHASTEAQLTEAGVVPGTVRYMSPEQLRGDALDERTDLFSLGVVMFEMVGGAHPFGTASVAETMAAILMRDPPGLGDDVPAELRRIVLKCMEKDRGRRYQTARDLAVDLDALGRESAASAATLRPPSAVVPHAGRGGWIAAGLAAASAIGVALWSILGRPGPASAPSVAEYVQLTDFADSASTPAISPDGTMLAFFRSRAGFLTNGQIYVKRLPNGEAKQLTNDPRSKYGPQFTPDGNRVIYTTIDSAGWSTWSVPVIGGDVSQVLPNSAGLTWIDDRHILFSEVEGRGLHMGVVTSTPTRADRRVLYFPPHVRAMAHYSAISPDRKWVLVVEMNRTGGWDPCRVIPFEGAAPPRQVGPSAPCTTASWSPDGQWMYFIASDGAASHIWRQRFPDGTPEPVTSGSATDEQGLAIESGGKSLITSVGRQSSALWIHDATGERLLSSEGFAGAPVAARDGRRVYYLLRRVDSPESHLAVIDVATGRTDVVLPDVSTSQFVLSSDEKTVAYVTARRQVVLAALDKGSPPRTVAENADNVRFGSDNDVFFRSVEGQANFLDRIKRDGSSRRRVLDMPILQLVGATPDGHWLVVHTAPTADDQMVTDVVAVPVGGGESRRICATYCTQVSWSADGRSLFLSDFRRTLAVPLPSGRWFPEFPGDGSPGIVAWTNIKGARWIESMSVASADSSSYVFVKREDLRNLFRIPIK